LVYRIEAVMPLEVEVPSFEGIDRFWDRRGRVGQSEIW
jgi:hypothetical protein